MSDLRVVVKNAVDGFSDSNITSMLTALGLKSSGSKSKKIELIHKKLDSIPESKLLMLKKMFNIEGD